MAMLTKAQKAELEALKSTIKDQSETISGLEQDMSNYKSENDSNLKLIKSLKMQLKEESAKIESNNKIFMKELVDLQVEKEDPPVRNPSVFVNAH